MNGAKNVGQTYVVFGASGNTQNMAVRDIVTSGRGFVVNGVRAHDLSGLSIQGNADLNGDSVADLLITAPFADAEGLVDSGQSYVLFGGNDVTTSEFNLADLVDQEGVEGLRGLAIHGSTRKSSEGSDVRVLDDSDGDGVSDILIDGTVVNLTGFEKPQIRTVTFRETRVFLDNFDDGVEYDDRDWDQYSYGATLHSTEGTQVTIWGDPHVVITIDGVTERFDIGYGEGEIVLDDMIVRWASAEYDPTWPDKQLPLMTFSIDAVGNDYDVEVATDDQVNVVDRLTSMTDSQLRDFASELRRYAGSATDPLRRV